MLDPTSDTVVGIFDQYEYRGIGGPLLGWALCSMLISSQYVQRLPRAASALVASAYLALEVGRKEK